LYFGLVSNIRQAALSLASLKEVGVEKKGTESKEHRKKKAACCNAAMSMAMVVVLKQTLKRIYGLTEK